MVVFSIVAIKFFIIRLVVFFVFMGLLLLIFLAFSEVTETREEARLANNIGEVVMTSNLTERKGVFSLTRTIGGFTLDDLNASKSVIGAIELPRYCNRGTQFFLDRLRDKRRWSWGFLPGPADAEKKFVAWVKEGNATEPAILTVKVKRDGLVFLTCAIEKAYLYKQVQEFDLANVRALFTNRYFKDKDFYCVIRSPPHSGEQPQCRWLPLPQGLSVEEFTSGAAKIFVVPIKEGGDKTCPAKGKLPSGAFTTDDDRKNFKVETVQICLS